MTEKDVAHQIDEASISEALKIALRDLVEKVGLLQSRLSISQRRRLEFMLNQLVIEATDETEDHWWEVALDFIAKVAKENGEQGQQVVQAVKQIHPLLQERLGQNEEVNLLEITSDTVAGICLLSETLTEPKKGFVAPNALSLAQAHFNKYAWFRAIYAGKAPVGFVMIVDNDEEEKYFVWRFMIAEPYHGRGYGRQAMERLVEYVKTRPGAKELLVSCGLGEGSPEGFYEKLGFVHTDEMIGDEVVMRLALE